MSNIQSWVQASRLPSQTYIAFPILAGQMVALAAGYGWSWAAFALAQLFGLVDQLYIVYANDWADVETDKNNETYNMFSGGSRVIVEGKISRAAIGRAAVLMAVLSLAVGASLALLNGTPAPLILIAVGLLLLWAYSYLPFRLSYRGAGEILQMLGVGGILPLVGFTAQGGSLAAFPWEFLAITLPISLACAVATSLPDEPSDRMSAKRTGSVVFGPVRAQVFVLVFALISLAMWVLLPSSAIPSLVPRLVAVALPVLLWLFGASSAGSLPGTPRLTSFVTLMVASNVTFFLAMSLATALG